MAQFYDPTIFGHLLAIVMPLAALMGFICPALDVGSRPRLKTWLMALVSGLLVALVMTAFLTAMEAVPSPFDEP